MKAMVLGKGGVLRGLRAAVKGWRLENAGAGTNTFVALRVTENAIVLDVIPKGAIVVIR